MRSDTFMEIGPFSRLVGVSPELLRVWERRYGLLEPVRDANGRRLYGRREEQLVKAMSRAQARGLRAREAAQEALTSADGDSGGDGLGEVATRLRKALDRLDDARANEQLDRLFSGYSMDTALGEVILPYLHDLGERWACNEIGVGHEHFASNLIAGRLFSLARGWGGGSGPRALLACPPGEQHTIGLMAFGLSLRSHGWRITYLGTDTPIGALGDLLPRVRPERVVMASVRASTFEASRAELQALARQTPLAIAGRGASDRVAAKLGATALVDDPVVEASRLRRRASD